MFKTLLGAGLSATLLAGAALAQDNITVGADPILIRFRTVPFCHGPQASRPRHVLPRRMISTMPKTKSKALSSWPIPAFTAG
tara:strand:+ start:942 stop:1187 length:246 start_codon:yes stop_codon:yes gene_type:complete